VQALTLIYHDVLAASGSDDSGFAGADAASYKLPVAQFQRHLDIVARSLGSRQPLCASDAATLTRSATPALLLTFDDGGASGVDRIAGLLEARGWRAHFFVVSELIGKPGFLTVEGMRRLHASGHVVGSHSASHPARLSHCPPDVIRREWQDSCSRIADVVGAQVITGSVPGGFYSRTVGQIAAQCGLRVLFTSEPTIRPHRLDDMLVLGRISVTRRTSDRALAALVQMRPRALLGQQISWGAKKVVKRVAGEAWLAARKKIFDRGLF
jgi:peptidoglycan/xylan/chitin deacetylase (PgdA/CDA1 family)